MGCRLLGACDVIQDGRHIGRHLRFYQKFDIVKETLIGHVEYDIIKLFATFC